MRNREQLPSSQWAWLLLAIAIFCLILRIDPIGDSAAWLFGEWARRWATDVVMIALLVWVLIRVRKK